MSRRPGARFMRRTRVRRVADERARKRPGVPLAHRLAPHDLPIVARAHHVVLVAECQREVLDGGVGWLEMEADDPRLHEPAIAVEVYVLISLEVHRGGVHEQPGFETLE